MFYRSAIITALLCSLYSVVPALAQADFPTKDFSGYVADLKAAEADTQRLVAYRGMYGVYQGRNPDSAILFLREGLALFQRHHYQLGIASTQAMLGASYSAIGKVDSAMTYLTGSLALYKKINHINGQGVAHNSLGVLEGKAGNFNAATSHFFAALKLFESINDTVNIANTYVKLGVVNTFNNNFDDALTYYHKTLDYLKDDTLNGNLSSTYNNIGTVYCHMGQFQKSIPYFKDALRTAPGQTFARLRVSPLTNLGSVYNNLANYGLAMQYYNQALALLQQLNLREEQTRLLLNMASVVANTNAPRSVSMMQEALGMARGLGNKILQIEILDGLQAGYSEMGDYRSALATLEELKGLQDSIFTIDKAKQIADLQSSYELDKSNERIKVLQKEREDERREAAIMIAIAAMLAALLVGVFILYRRNAGLVTRITKHEAELEMANKDKDRLLSIIGHDLRSHIANIPLVLQMHNDPNTTPGERAFLLSSLNDNSVAAVETLEKLLHWGKSQIKGVSANPVVFNVQENMENKMRLMRSVADRKTITLHNNIPDALHANADVDHFRFIMRNLMANAIKYTGNGGHVYIDADTDSMTGYIRFAVRDTGVGIAGQRLNSIFEPFNISTPGTDNESGNSIGLMLCREFAERNGGRIWVESAEGLGATFYFTLKQA